MSLGKWALLDIETTGVSAMDDHIIDMGFLSFEGTKLTKKYSSLVNTDKTLTPFIQHLTEITPSMVKTAPKWDVVQEDLALLDEHILIAHNASFENGFLASDFEFLGVNPIKSEMGHYFADSLLYLALIHPGRSSLKLSSFIIDYEIADKEIHRGYEDSRDLLKVMLRATYELHANSDRFGLIKEQVNQIDNFWFKNFINLTKEELEEIGNQIQFHVSRGKMKSKTESDKQKQTAEIGFSSQHIKDVFENEELMNSHFENYQVRDQQVQMSGKVGQSFANGVHSIIQAPTGTGKTLSYLIPSLLFALEKKKQVLISTGTKVLQSQLEDKDLGKALGILGLEGKVKVTKLIGTTNHLCIAKFEREKSSQTNLLESGFEKTYVQAYLEILVMINERSTYSNMLTKEDLPRVISRILPSFNEAVENVALDFKTCLGHRCPFVKNCSYFSGLEQAKNSEIIIGNHALTFLWPSSLDRPEYIIFDEAHKIEETATSAFSVVTPIERMNKFLSRNDGGTSPLGAFYYLMDLHEISYDPTSLRKFLNDSFMAMKNVLAGLTLLSEKLAKELTRYTSEYWNEYPFRQSGTPLESSFFNELSSLSQIMSAVKLKLVEYYKIFDEMEMTEHGTLTAWTQFRGYFNQIDEYEMNLINFLGEDDEYCRSVKFHEEYGTELLSVPIDIGEIVHAKVLEPSNAVVFTSATLGSMDGRYGRVSAEWQTGYMLTEPSKRFESGTFLPPVFDYKANAKVFLATDLPPIYTNEYVSEVLGHVIPHIIHLKGKSLLLFSSYKRFESAREILLLKLQGKMDVFYQGMGKTVVDEFKKSDNAILIGLESFGEGIDIPGESLQFVYIDKIPDMDQSLIIEERKKFFDKHLGNSFSEYFMATRARKLQQKLGRLLRTSEDKGVILVTDPRVGRWKDRTINQFKNYLSPYEVEKIQIAEFQQLNQ